MPKGSVQTLVLAILVVCLPGCGVDRETLATPTRYLDSSIPSIELPLFANPDFEEAQDGRPAYWTPREKREQHVTLTGEEVYSGECALRLEPGPEWYFVRQHIDANPERVSGKILTIAVMAKAGTANDNGIQLSIAGLHTFISPRHPGDGEWHELSVSCYIPPWWSKGKIVCTLTTGGSPGYPVYFDDLRVWLK